LALQYGEDSEQVQSAKDEIDELQKASRGAKPYKTHRGQLERRLERLQRQQSRAKEEEDEALVEVERAQERLNGIRRGITEREKNIAAVDEELKELLRRAISEGETADQQGQQAAEGDPDKAWETISSTLAAMVAQPGVPAGWAQQMGALLEQVRVAAMAIRQHAGTPPLKSGPQPPTSGTTNGAATSQRVGSSSATSAASSSTSPSSPTPPAPSPPSAPPLAAAPSAAAAAAASPPLQSGTTSSGRWASRAQELAFTEGMDSGGNQGTADGGDKTSQEIADGDGKAQEEEPDSGSEDDMESVLGGDLERKENETAIQHKRRMAKMLRERAERRREAKRREGRLGGTRRRKEGGVRAAINKNGQ
jgi:hypothetical protein